MMNIRPLQLAVLAILDNWEHYEWSVQGFGLLRFYIRRLGRLHIWDSALRYPNVSTIHNHSWDLRSTVVSGKLCNTRYVETQFGIPFRKQRVVTGYNSTIVSTPESVSLLPMPREIYQPGEIYAQTAHVVHLTEPVDGTITLMERHEDINGEAEVYWPIGAAFGTAKPRPATNSEARSAVLQAARILEQNVND